MYRLLRATALFIALAAYAAPAAAIEPLVMFLLNAASQMLEQTASRPAPPAPTPPTYPGTTVRPQQLQAVIDASFDYLSPQQRREIFASFNRELLRPQNAAVRGAMIEYFIDRAAQVRAARLRLAHLSTPEKEALAASFGKRIAALPAPQLAELQRLVEGHLLPVPGDLNAMLLAQLGRLDTQQAAAVPQPALAQ